MNDTAIQNDYAFWHAAIQGTPIGGDELPVSADRPQCGFYRMRRGIRAPWECVAIWRGSDMELVAAVDNKKLPAMSIWHWCCVNPITEEAYKHALVTGQWGDVDDAILELQNQDALPARFKTNAPYERLKQQIDLAVGSAALYDVIADDVTSMKAQSLRSKLTELAGKADALRTDEKKPFLEQCRLVDGVWQPVIKGAQNAAGTIRKALSRYETLKASEAALSRRNEPLPTKVATGYGRAASIREKIVVDRVEDWVVVFAHYCRDERAQAQILKLAEKDAANGLHVPGITTKTEKDVR